MKFTLTKINLRKLTNLIKINNEKFFADVRNRWMIDSQDIISIINNTMLTEGSDTSLKKRSGLASRVIMSKTVLFKLTKTVINKFFLDKNNPASKYLPIHDKSYKGSRIIRPVNGAWLKFKTAEGNWVTTKRVRIPARTNIMKLITKEANKKFVTSVNESIKVFAWMK